MIDEREKPLSEIRVDRIASQVLHLAEGEDLRVPLDVSAGGSFLIRATLAERSSLTILALGEVRGEISIVRMIDEAGAGSSIRFLSAIRVCEGAKVTLDSDIRVSSSDVRCEIDDRLVAEDGSRSIVRHRVVVEKDVARSAVSTAIRGMISGEEGSIRAIPELDIRSNTVQAKHAVSITLPQKETLAYFATRGIPRKEAMTLLAEQLLCPISRL